MQIEGLPHGVQPTGHGEQWRDAIFRQQRLVGIHAARDLEEGVNQPVEPERNAQ